MASADLSMFITAHDKASPVFNKVAASADKLGKSTEKAGKAHSTFARAAKYAFGMVSAYSIGRFLNSSVKEYAAAELAQNKLSTAYQRFPKLADYNIGKLRDLNTALMQKTRFDDDAAAAMQANLARYDLTGKQVAKLTPLVMDLAEATGTDLVTAGGQLGKSFLGNTRALKALGISYTATGDRAKDMRAIITALNDKVGGESTRAAKTAAVKLEILKNQYGELKESVGQALLPAFSKLVEVAGPQIAKLGAVVDRNMPQIERAFENLFDVAGDVGRVVKNVWSGFAAIPPDVRNLLLALAGGTWAVGKIKGSAFGQGLGTIFSAVKGMNVNAGVVNVNGKVSGPGGTPGGKGGSTISKSAWLAGEGAGLVSMLSSAAVVSAITVAAGAAYYKLMDPMPKIRQQGGNPTTLAGGYGSNRTINTSKPQIRQDWVDKQAEVSAARYAAQWKLVTVSIKDASGAYTQFAFQSKNKKWVDENQPRAIDAAAARYKALAKAVKDVPNKKSTKVDAPGAKESKGRVEGLDGAVRGLKGKSVKVAENGADPSRGRVNTLKGAIGGLRGKTVPVKESGADQSRGRVRNLDGSIRSLNGKTVNVGVNGADNARTQVYNLVTAINSLHDKTVTTYYREVKAGQVKNAATGGLILGPGGPTDDMIPARLSDGEYVVRAAAVDRYGVDFLHALNAMSLPGYAKGGKVNKEQAKEIRQARNEANRQARIAKQIEKRGLGDNVITYLGGLSSKAALTALAGTKNAAVKGSLGAAAFAGALAKIPAKKDTKVTATGADEAKGRVKGLGGAIGGLRGKTVPVKESGADQSRGRVRNLGGAIGGLRGKTVGVDEDGAVPARANVQNLVNSIAQLRSKTIDIVTRYRTEGGAPGKEALKASGGLILGPGGPTDDMIPARLSDGEYVVRAAAVDRYGVDFLHALNAMSLPGYAKGGKVNKEQAKEIRQARNEANRQARIAKQIEKRGLGDNVITYLGGLSSKAALTALAGTKNAGLRKAAKRSSAIGDLQTRRQNARDAAQQAREDARQAAQDASEAERQAAEDAARAAEEAAQALADAQDKALDKVNAIRDAIEATASSYRSFASIATTSVGDVSEAQDKLTAANDKVTEARKKFDLAGNDRDRAAAARELAAAEQESTAAQKARNDVSDKPTTGSIRANMAGKLAKLKGFAAAVKQLKANGLNAVTLADILGMGPEQGYDYAKALLDGGLADINAVQADITATSADLGLFTAGNSNDANAAINAANLGAAGISVSLVPAPVTLSLDGATIAQALIAYQRQAGG